MSPTRLWCCGLVVTNTRYPERRVGPTYDTLTVVVQPWPDRTNYTVKRVHFDGSVRRDTRIASGALHLAPAYLVKCTPAELLHKVLAEMDKLDEVPASPWGSQGEQLSLNLDLRP